MPKFLKGKKKNFHKRKMDKIKYGRKLNKDLFRSVRPYGIKPDPFPQRLNTRCKYAFGLKLTTSSTLDTVGTEQLFRLTSIYDPYATATGANNRTVVGHSTFRTIYNNYIVNGAKVEIEFSNPEVDGLVGLASLNQTKALQAYTVRECNEQHLVYTTVLNNTGSQKKKMSFYVRPWSLIGLSKMEWIANKEDHSAGIDNDPVQPIYLRVGVANENAAVARTMHCSVRIIYYVTFFNRIQLESTSRDA